MSDAQLADSSQTAGLAPTFIQIERRAQAEAPQYGIRQNAVDEARERQFTVSFMTQLAAITELPDDAKHTLANHVWERVRAACPDAHLHAVERGLFRGGIPLLQRELASVNEVRELTGARNLLPGALAILKEKMPHAVIHEVRAAQQRSTAQADCR